MFLKVDNLSNQQLALEFQLNGWISQHETKYVQ